MLEELSFSNYDKIEIIRKTSNITTNLRPKISENLQKLDEKNSFQEDEEEESSEIAPLVG